MGHVDPWHVDGGHYLRRGHQRLIWVTIEHRFEHGPVERVVAGFFLRDVLQHSPDRRLVLRRELPGVGVGNLRRPFLQ